MISFPHSSQSPNFLTLIQWCGVFIPAAYLAYSGWTRAHEDRTERTSQARQVRHRRDHGVSIGAPIPTDGDLALSSEDEVHVPKLKGRQFSTATALNHGSPSHSIELPARTTAPSSIGDQDRHGDNATNGQAPGSSSPRILFATVQGLPLPSEAPVDPPCTPAGPRISFADPTTKRTWSVPIPEPPHANHNRTPSRYESLPHDPNYERTPPHLTKTTSLRTTLYVGSKDLSSPFVIQWFILFIAVNIDEDSEHNLGLFREMLNLPTDESTSIYFESLAGADATPSNIKAKIRLLYLRAGCVADDSLVLVFLTGTGDATNRMRLLNKEVVTDENLRDWVSDVRIRSGLKNVQTVPIIFDICRENKDIPSAKMHQIVELLWSCSLGQRAHAIGFASNVPNSCFLLALFWAASDISDSASPDFEKAFRFRLGQLVRIRRYSHDYWLQELGQCEECGIGNQCTPPKPQEPEGEQAGWDVVASLGALIMARYPEYVRNIVTVLTKEMERCEIWEANNATFSSSSLQSEAIAQHANERRGATQPVAAASGRNVHVIS